MTRKPVQSNSFGANFSAPIESHPVDGEVFKEDLKASKLGNDVNRPIPNPQIFIPNEGTLSLKKVYLERYTNIDLLWYNWPRDGLLRWENDYEPIALVYKDSDISYVITRRHWSYQAYSIDQLSQPLQIRFDGIFHPPYPRTMEGQEQFDAKTVTLVSRDYMSEIVDKDFIPSRFRKGNGHACMPGNKIEKDPVEYANEIYNDFCKDK